MSKFCTNDMISSDDKYGLLRSRSCVEKSNVCQMRDASYEITTNDGVLGCVVSHQMQLPSVYFQAYVYLPRTMHTYRSTYQKQAYVSTTWNAYIHTEVHTINRHTITNSGMFPAYQERYILHTHRCAKVCS